MPLKKVKYRVKTTKSGKKVRLAFRAGTNQVVEAKNLETGATHTPKEFARDRKRKKRAPKRQR